MESVLPIISQKIADEVIRELDLSLENGRERKHFGVLFKVAGKDYMKCLNILTVNVKLR